MGCGLPRATGPHRGSSAAHHVVPSGVPIHDAFGPNFDASGGALLSGAVWCCLVLSGAAWCCLVLPGAVLSAVLAAVLSAAVLPDAAALLEVYTASC